MVEIFDKMMAKEFDEKMLLSKAYASVNNVNADWVFVENDCSIKEHCHRTCDKLEEEGKDLDRFFKSDEFKSCNMDDNETQLKNSLHKYLNQNNLSTLGSVFAPTIEIDKDVVNKLDLDALKKSMRIKD